MMLLSPSEVERFYQLWFPLLHYVNQQRHVVENFPDTWETRVDRSIVVAVRNALWAEASLLDAFIAENPAKLSATDLALVASWKYRVADKFFVMRYLQRHAIFLSEGPPSHVYGVLGLTNPFEEFLGSYLPVYVSAVLLPFNGKIIYDGLITPNNLLVGDDYQASLNFRYHYAQKHDGIITTLTPADNIHPDDLRKGVEASNNQLLVAFQKELKQAKVSPKKMGQHYDNMAAFAQDYLLNQESPRLLLNLTTDDVHAYLTHINNLNPISLKRFLQFLRNTGRIQYDQAQEMLALVEQAR